MVDSVLIKSTMDFGQLCCQQENWLKIRLFWYYICIYIKRKYSNHPAVKEVNFLTNIIYDRQIKNIDELYLNISDQ